MSAPPWLATVRTSFRHLFEAGSTTHDRCQLMAGDEDHLVMIRATGLASRYEKVDVFRLAGAPDYNGPAVAYLFGTAESVEKFKRAAHSAGALIPGIPPQLFGAAWIAFVLQTLPTIHGHVLRARSTEENTDCEASMVNPFLDSLLVIDGAEQTPKPAGKGGIRRRGRRADPEKQSRNKRIIEAYKADPGLKPREIADILRGGITAKIVNSVLKQYRQKQKKSGQA